MCATKHQIKLEQVVYMMHTLLLWKYAFLNLKPGHSSRMYLLESHIYHISLKIFQLGDADGWERNRIQW
jgi:hypothetical protein